MTKAPSLALTIANQGEGDGFFVQCLWQFHWEFDTLITAAAGEAVAFSIAEVTVSHHLDLIGLCVQGDAVLVVELFKKRHQEHLGAVFSPSATAFKV